MEALIRFFVRNHLFADILSVIVVGFGLYAMFNIKRETFPNVHFDIISISTTYLGATPEEVEKLITNPIEQDLKEVDGIKKIQSTSVENRSEIFVYLDPDQTTEDEAKSDIKDVIDKLTDLPEEADEPKVSSLETKTQPIIEIGVYGNFDDLQLREYAKKIELELEKISGVSKVTARGERELEVRVEPDVRLLARYRVTLNEVIEALKRQNVSVSAGFMEGETTEKVVRVIGDYKSIRDVENTVVRANELGSPILVKDIAKVGYDLERAQVINRVNGHKAISLSVAKKEKADAINVVDDVKAHLEKLVPTINPDIGVEYVNDFSYYIRNRLSIVTSNLLIGLACVLLLLPFLLPYRFAFLVALGEPFAFLGAILVMYWFDQSINLISMIGLIIVSGILVDDSIVVTENAVRRIEDGEDPKVAAVKGTLQIFGPLTASVFTTIVVFLPMANMSGIFGKFIVQIPIAVLICLLASLFETYFILPAHIAHWVNAKSKNKMQVNTSGIAGQLKGLAAGVGNFFIRASTRSIQFWDTRIEPLYVRTLETILHRRYLTLGLVFLFFIFSVIVGAMYAKKRFILFPPEGIEIFFIRTEAPNGTGIYQHENLLKPIEAVIGTLPKSEMINFVTNVGIQQQDPNDPFTKRGSEYAQIAVYLTPENQRDRTAIEIIEDLRKQVGQRTEFARLTFDRLNPGPPTGKPVSLGVRGKDFETILPAVSHLKKILSEISGVIDINDTYLLGKEEVQIVVDPETAASAGLSVATVGYTVRAAFEGHIATTIKSLEEDQNVRVALPRQQSGDLAVLDKILIPNSMGNLIPLRQVSRIEKGQSLLAIQHEANERQINVTAGVDNNLTSSIEVNTLLRDMLPEINAKFPNVTVAFGGEDEDTKESFASLGRTFLVAIAGVYLILILAFGNLHQPLVIMLTVPLGLVSVLWAFILHGMPISFMGCLGAVALTGVITNNAIVLVDFINQHQADTKDVIQGVLKASRDRLRPIFLTTVTTVIGVFPTAYGIGGLDKFIVPIALSLGWGLMFGALLSAFVFPPVLVVLEDVRKFLFGSQKQIQ